jgi:hypothetical protein
MKFHKISSNLNISLSPFRAEEDGEIASFKQRQTAWNCTGIGLKTQSNAVQVEPE